MSFSLIPANKGVEVLHVDFPTWSFLRQGLRLEGAKTTSMAFFPDGIQVDADTAADWGRRLQEGLSSGKLKIKKVPDNKVPGGVRYFFTLDESGEDASHAGHLQEFIQFCQKSGGFEQW